MGHFFVHFGHVFRAFPHIRENSGSFSLASGHHHFPGFWSHFSGHFAYKGKLCDNFTRFVSCFSAKFAYKGEMWGQFTFLCVSVFFP